MLTSIDVWSNRGTLLTLPMVDIPDGFIVRKIDGLGPVKATLVSTTFARLDGSQYQTSRREPRNLLFTIGIEPNFSIGDTVRSLRQKAYEFFMPKNEVTFTFHLQDGLDARISGRVESCEPTIFDKKTAIAVSVMCFDPDFLDEDIVEIDGNTTSSAVETLVDYPGSVETGIDLVLNVDRTMTAFTIYNKGPDNVLRSLDFSYDLAAGDVVEIVTTPGAKTANLTRSGTTTSILYAISPQSTWVEFLPGENYFRVYAEGAAVPYVLTYSNRYGGL
jgi:hypothetical protein